MIINKKLTRTSSEFFSKITDKEKVNLSNAFFYDCIVEKQNPINMYLGGK